MSAPAELLPPEQNEAPAKKSKTKAIARREETAIAPSPANDSQMLQSLMTEAIRSGNRELMREVMEIRRELKAEAAKEAFFESLSAFQKECPIIKKSKAVRDSGGGLRYHYAPLDTIVRIVAPLLTKHGLSYTIETKIIGTGDDGALEATCKIHHQLGHVEQSQFSVPVEPPKFMSKPQTFGAASMFAKRYAFVNALGILTGDDDNDAATPPQKTQSRQPVSQPKQTPTAQKANGAANGVQRPDLEPAGEGEAIDAATIKGLTLAMEHAALGNEDFKKRFTKLSGLEDVRKADSRVVMKWIGDPTKN